VGHIAFPENRYRTAAEKGKFVEQLLLKTAQLPGVTSVAESIGLPLYEAPTSDVTIPGKPHTEKWETLIEPCSGGYFTTLGLQLLRGRLLSNDDIAAGRQVAVINRTMAEHYFRQEDPIGRQIRFTVLDMIPETPHGAYFEIVGVVSDFKNSGIQRPPMPEAFLPHSFTGFGDRGLLLRSSVQSDSLLKSVQRILWDMDRDVVLAEPVSLQLYLQQNSYGKPRFSVICLGACASVGLLLSVIGLFSVMAFTVFLLTHDLGVRIALGAKRSAIVAMVLSRGARLIGGGLLLGCAASLLIVRVLQNQLWGVSAFDPLTFSLVPVVLLVVGMLACYFPALKATRVDPTTALRCE
jgi:putative ABC transport system permease protein